MFTRSPLDVERSLPNMRDGDLLVGAFANEQVGYRPAVRRRRRLSHPSAAASISADRAAIPAATSPGFPAYNAAQVILADLGVAADWMPPPIAPRLAAM